MMPFNRVAFASDTTCLLLQSSQFRQSYSLQALEWQKSQSGKSAEYSSSNSKPNSCKICPHLYWFETRCPVLIQVKVPSSSNVVVFPRFGFSKVPVMDIIVTDYGCHIFKIVPSYTVYLIGCWSDSIPCRC